jgi:hypothetical protein
MSRLPAGSDLLGSGDHGADIVNHLLQVLSADDPVAARKKHDVRCLLELHTHADIFWWELDESYLHTYELCAVLDGGAGEYLFRLVDREITPREEFKGSVALIDRRARADQPR